MKIIIDIDEEMIKALEQGCFGAKYNMYDLVGCVMNGTPIDLDGLKDDMKSLRCGFPFGLDYLIECIKNRLGISIEGSDSE